MNKSNALGLIAVIILIGGLFAYIDYYDYKSKDALPFATSTLPLIPDITASTTVATSTTTVTLVSYGIYTLRLNEKRTFGNTTISPWAVLEDSRCASDVQCVWAGKVTVAVSITSPTRNSSLEMNPGTSITSSGLTITLKDVTPYPISSHKIQDSEYRFIFDIRPSSTAATPPPTSKSSASGGTSGCFVGGCSGQICSSSPGAISTCEYKQEYACYRTARCEKQSNGQCGWTETPELKQCLMNGSNTAI